METLKASTILQKIGNVFKLYSLILKDIYSVSPNHYSMEMQIHKKVLDKKKKKKKKIKSLHLEMSMRSLI